MQQRGVYTRRVIGRVNRRITRPSKKTYPSAVFRHIMQDADAREDRATYKLLDMWYIMINMLKVK